MYRIIRDKSKDNKFFIQITAEENRKRCGVQSHGGYCTLCKFKDNIYKGFYDFDTKEDAKTHITTLNHTESFMPDRAQSKLPTEN